MKARFMKSCVVLALQLAFAPATPPAYAGVWRSSETDAPKKRATTTKPAAKAKPSTTATKGTTARQGTTVNPVATTKTNTTAPHAANTAAREATSVGMYGQTVYHSIHDWEPGSLSRETRQSTRSATADSDRSPRASGGVPRERAVEVNEAIPIPTP